MIDNGLGCTPLPCRASPPQVGRSNRGDLPTLFNVATQAEIRRLANLLLVGEMTARPEGGGAKPAVVYYALTKTPPVTGSFTPVVPG